MDFTKIWSLRPKGLKSKYGIFSIDHELKLEATLKNVLTSIQSTTGEARVVQLQKLWLMITPNDDTMKLFICHHEFGVLSLLANILSTDLDISVLHTAIGCIWYLSRNEQISIWICSKEIPLVSNLMYLLQQYPILKLDLLKIIGNCALVTENHTELLLSRYELIPFLKYDIQTSNEDLSYQVLTCLVSAMIDEECHIMIHYNIPQTIFQHLFQLLDLQYYANINQNILYWCINYIMLFSFLPNGVEALITQIPFIIPFFQKFLIQENITSIKIAVIFANLFGKYSPIITSDASSVISTTTTSSPTTTTTSSSVFPSRAASLKEKERLRIVLGGRYHPETFLSNHSFVFPLLLKVYDVTLNYSSKLNEYRQLNDKGFGYGVIKMRNLTGALRNFAFYEENQNVMVQKREQLFPLIFQTIELYIENAPECSGMGSGTGAGIKEFGGGGGKDMETIENVLELLIQLSFGKYSDAIFQYLEAQNYIIDQYNIGKQLENLLHLPAERNVSLLIQQYARILSSTYYLQTKEGDTEKL